MASARRMKTQWIPEKVPDLLAIAMLLFPGFLFYQVYEYLAYREAGRDFDVIASALSATLVVASLTWVIVPPFLKRSWRWSNAPYAAVVGRPSYLVASSVVAVIAGVIWAGIDNHGLIYRSLKVLPLTDRISRASVWDKGFQHNEGREDKKWSVRVTTKRGVVFVGDPYYYSTGSDKRALYIVGALRYKDPQGSEGRAPATCDPVGTILQDGALRGDVLLLEEEIRIVEFRPLIPGKDMKRLSCP